jgi:hypothetical protein
MIASHFDQVTVYASSEQRFKQVVIFGIRCKSKPADKIVVTKLINAAQDITTLDTLTDQPNLDKESCFYRLPLSSHY